MNHLEQERLLRCNLYTLSGDELLDLTLDRNTIPIPILTSITPAPRLVILPTNVSVKKIDTSTTVPKKHTNTPKAMLICFKAF